MSTLEGKVAIVTGTTSGVGRATASALTRAGATVIGVARRSEEQVGPIGAPGAGSYVHMVGDVTLPATAAEVSARAIYCASKHAQVGFTHAMRHELQPHGIKVGVICPAGIETAFALGRGRTQEGIDEAGYLSPDDVADAVLFAATQNPRAMMVDIGLVAVTEL